MIVVISGLPGVGKSAVATDLAGRLSAVHLSIDPVEDALLGAGLPAGWQTGVAAYEATRASAELNLALGRVVVVDAVNDSEPARATWRVAAERAGVLAVFVLLTCEDEVEHRRRLEGRSRGFGRLPEPTWPEVVERMATYEPWGEAECLVVDTAQPLPVVVEEVARHVDERRPAVPRPAVGRRPPQDGEAVAAARSALIRHWRSTVVPGDQDDWVVRTWTSTPPGDSRPSGAPDVVHRVVEQRGKLVVQQVHPSG
jgi:predicted kinase